VESTAQGNAGSINITTGSLSVTNGAQLQASTRGRGDAGSVNILASDHVSFGQSSGVLSTVEQTAKGNGGSINISTGSLSITNSAQMVVGTRGRGDAGSVNIYAPDTISLDGVGSGVLSTVESTAEGNAGSINITTGFLSVTNGAQLVVGTRGRGDAGTVNISAHDTVSFDGVGSVGSQEIRSGVFSTAEPEIVGNGGSINITTDFLSVTNRAGVFTTSFGQGNAGDIQIKARDLLLNNRGVIVAETASGNGGNITLNVRDLLLMRRNSIISTTAATAQPGDNSNIGDGGNIKINAQFIVAVPKEDSNIRADAIIGKGGNIEITTSGIFGFQSPLQETPLSDITASSDFGVQGAINIRVLMLTPTKA
jgi:large exoprotein involved in heme utilization and adhesion